jgi:hypothetical protein
MAQKIRFMKNVTITGGMLMAWAFGPVRFSLDRDEPALVPRARLITGGGASRRPNHSGDASFVRRSLFRRRRAPAAPSSSRSRP